jgi:hypothetical protein
MPIQLQYTRPLLNPTLDYTHIRSNRNTDSSYTNPFHPDKYALYTHIQIYTLNQPLRGHSTRLVLCLLPSCFLLLLRPLRASFALIRVIRVIRVVRVILCPVCPPHSHSVIPSNYPHSFSTLFLRRTALWSFPCLKRLPTPPPLPSNRIRARAPPPLRRRVPPPARGLKAAATTRARRGCGVGRKSIHLFILNDLCTYFNHY